MGSSVRIWQTQDNYRVKTTRGVASVAVILLVPFSLVALMSQMYAYFIGGVCLILLLGATAYMAGQGRDHQPLTLFALVPGSILLIVSALYTEGISASIGCFPLIVACYCMLDRRNADIASAMVLLMSAPVMWLSLTVIESTVLTASLTVVIMFASMLMRQIEYQQKTLRYQIERDPMTGLLNRTSLSQRLENSVDVFRSDAVPAALLTLDLDYFKRVNDMFGHETGDLVLCEVAKLLEKNVADDCSVFRMGGEEFLILLANKGAHEARQNAELLRSEIAEAAIIDNYPIKVSIGMANLRSSDCINSWKRRSDNLLYVAKFNGRNRIISDSEKGSGKSRFHMNGGQSSVLAKIV